MNNNKWNVLFVISMGKTGKSSSVSHTRIAMPLLKAFKKPDLIRGVLLKV